MRHAAGLVTAQYGLQARHQFTGLKGFGQVVVGAQFQTHHTVHHITARSEHDDGYIAFFADGTAEFKAVHLGQHYIQNHCAKRLMAQQRQALAGARSVGELQLKALKIGGQRRPKLRVVVDQQNTIHRIILTDHCDPMLRVSSHPDLYD